MTKKCCGFGEFKCDVPMAVSQRVVCVDYCIAHIVACLNAGGLVTISSCCGHGKIDGSIILKDGRHIRVDKKGVKQ